MSRDPQMTIQCKENVLVSKYGHYFTEPAIMIDDDGALLKYGEADMVNKYYNETVAKFVTAGIKTYVIEFNAHDDLNMDDVCSIVNYALNCHNETLKLMLQCDDRQTVREWIDKIKKWGY